ncbi:MAG: biopolymer transporter ExbD [Planctomycetota bacterium]|jgi:biopolymer transport protein ExbD
MRIREDYSEEAAVAFNIMSLIDIVFFLLIFFLAVTSFTQVERDAAIRLPSAGAASPLSSAPSNMTINVLENGSVKVGDQPCTWKELTDILGDVAASNAIHRKSDEPEKDILIRADKNSRHEYFASVVELAYRVGIDRARIGYEVDTSGPAAGSK